MTGTLTQSIAHPTDADLVLASRQGDREAFGKIVRRYQAMITGLIYAACGDLQRSEELAQDTFVSAWKSLSGLRDPSKLPAWLCQVARHRLLDHSRSEARRTERLTQAFHHREDPSTPPPDEHLLNNEERELLWKTLREIAQPYRETLVLYYRQGKSVSDVALAMETTEANVRQRLTRGREMLREQVAAMLERNLVRSAPAPAFALAVVAALPAFVPSTATAAAIGSAAVKGTAATAKGTGLLAAAAFWFGPLFGLAGGALGTWNSIRQARHPREKQLVVRISIFTWIYVFAAMAILFGLTFAQQHYRWSGQTYALLISAFWLVYIGLLITFVTVANRRLRAIRKELNLPEPQTPAAVSEKRWLAFAGASIGAVGWMAGLAIEAHDTTALIVVAIAAALAVLVCRRFVPGRPVAAIQRFAILHVLGLGLFTLVMVNWRLYRWIAATGEISVAEAQHRIPLWTMNLFTLVLIAVMLVTVRMSFRAANGSAQG
jgi:RNA polymerase sigma factor (sigma-70 family)